MRCFANVFRTVFCCCAAALLLLCVVAAGAAQAQDEDAAAARLKRRWRVMVIVPETHLARPRIPDPAVETELCRQLIDAGYKVIDQDRIKDLRYSAVVDRIIDGGPTAKKEAIQLMRRFGADVLVTGEAFSEEALRSNITTELGTVQGIRCRARVELKAIRMDTGEKFFADSMHRTGPPEPGEALSSKAALRDAAEAVGPKMLEKFDKIALSATQAIELHVRGIGSAARGGDLEEALARVPGIVDVAPGEMDGGEYHIEIEVEKTAIRGLARALESTPGLRAFKMKAQSVSGSKIIVNCGK